MCTSSLSNRHTLSITQIHAVSVIPSGLQLHANGCGYRIKLLTGELTPLSGQMNRNGRLRMYAMRLNIQRTQGLTSYCSGYFAQHHVDTLTPTMSPVSFLASKFPGKSEQEYRSHLGNFQITGMTGCVLQRSTR